jgi:hypothetical protein
MKADQSGSVAEKSRFKQGWLTPQERKQKGVQDKCGDCAAINSNHGAYCQTLMLSTHVDSVCDNFIPRSTKDI